MLVTSCVFRRQKVSKGPSKRNKSLVVTWSNHNGSFDPFQLSEFTALFFHLIEEHWRWNSCGAIRLCRSYWRTGQQIFNFTVGRRSQNYFDDIMRNLMDIIDSARQRFFIDLTQLTDVFNIGQQFRWSGSATRENKAFRFFVLSKRFLGL